MKVGQKRTKTGGRKAGTPNKFSLPMREFISAFLERNAVHLQKDWDQLDAAQRLVMFEKLLRFIVPPMQSVDVSGKVNLSSFSEPELDLIIEKLLLNAANNG